MCCYRFHTLDTTSSFTEAGNRYFKRYNISLCGTEGRRDTVCKASKMSSQVSGHVTTKDRFMSSDTQIVNLKKQSACPYSNFIWICNAHCINGHVWRGLCQTDKKSLGLFYYYLHFVFCMTTATFVFMVLYVFVILLYVMFNWQS